MWRAAFLVLAGCGRIGFALVAGTTGGDAPAAGDDGATSDGPGADAPSDAAGACAWSHVAIVPNVSSPSANNWEPALSPAGDLLVFSRLAGSGGASLFEARRLGPGVFGTAVRSALNAANQSSGPAWSPDGSDLYFVSDRAQQGKARLYVASYDGSGFGSAREVPELASVSVVGPTISANGVELLYSSNMDQAESVPGHLYRATRGSAGGMWAVDRRLTEIEVGTTGDGFPGLSPDGLTMYWESDRDVAGGLIYSAQRPTLTAMFGSASKVAPLDTGLASGDPQPTVDGLTMLFAQQIAGTQQQNIYTAQWVCP